MPGAASWCSQNDWPWLKTVFLPLLPPVFPGAFLVGVRNETVAGRYANKASLDSAVVLVASTILPNDRLTDLFPSQGSFAAITVRLDNPCAKRLYAVFESTIGGHND